MSTIRIFNSPDTITRRLRQRWWLDPVNTSGGVAMAGGEQIQLGPMPRWRASIDLHVQNYEPGKQFRAYITRLRGRARAMRITPERCLTTSFYQRLGAVPPPSVGSGIPHSDGTTHSDGAGYAWPVPMFRLIENAEAFDNSIYINMLGLNRKLQVGDWFGLGGNLYLITAILDSTFDPIEGNRMRIEFEPNLRRAFTAPQDVTGRPTIVMRLSADDSGAFDFNDGPITNPSIELVEMPGLS